VNEGVFNPHYWQGEILLDKTPRKVVLTGRQSGKTTLLKSIIYKASLEKAQQDILVLASTHGQVKELLWRPFTNAMEALFPKELVAQQNNQDMTIELINGSRITFKGTENYESLLGRTVDLVIFDEWQSHKEEVWTYIEPMLAAKQGNAIFTGTARKGNHIMKFFDFALESIYWKSWRITTPESGSPAGTKHAIELAKASMSTEQFLQEYMCVPMSGEGLVYPKFSNENITDCQEVISKLKNDTLHIGVDFNISDMNAVICVRDKQVLTVIDEIRLRHANSNTYSMVQEIRRRYPDRNIILYPDATGRNRSTNTVDPQNTNHTILRQAGFPLKFDHSGNPPIEDRTILVNTKIQTADGTRTLYVDNKCKNLIYALQTRTYKDGKPIKDNVTDHGCDCLDYVLWHLFNTRNKMRSGVM